MRVPWYNIGYVSFFFVQVNLVDGLPSILYNETCTAGAGTIILEFGILSRLLGDPVFENFARKAVEALWKRRSLETGLLGEFTLYTLTSVCIFSILFPICFLRCWQGEFVEKSRASLVGDHFLYSCDTNVCFWGDIVRRN